MRQICIFLIKLYRKYISPLKPPCCIFTPTCSQYALDAFSEWGFFRGFWLTLLRILRCHPFCRGGNDPVPENPKKHGKKGAANATEIKGEKNK